MEYAQLVVTIVLVSSLSRCTLFVGVHYDSVINCFPPKAVDTVLKSFAMGCIPFWSSKRMAFDGVMISLCLLLDVRGLELECRLCRLTDSFAL